MIRKYNIKVNGVSYEVEVESADAENARPSGFFDAGSAFPAPGEAAPRAQSSGGKGTPVTAPMQGTVLKINVRPGEQIKKGQVLLILEAMKMENEISAPEDGTVEDVAVSGGSSVKLGQTLLTYVKA
jgi:biotin carboxyl carrier protein